MDKILGIPMEPLVGQLLVGLINGSFYALMSLGLSIIFGLIGVVNFAHGAQYMLGAFITWALLEYCGIGYWTALILAPAVVAVLGMTLERLLLRKLYEVDHVYALLLTFGCALLLEGGLRLNFGTSGQPYSNPIGGGLDTSLGFIPSYRVWVVGAAILVCALTWFSIERTKLGSYLRAANENADLVRTFGINVPRLLMVTYGLGAGLAGLSGVMAAPIYQVSPLMGSNMIIVVFAVVVVGGMSSVLGSIVTGFSLGVLEGAAKLVYPEASGIVIFLVAIITLTIRPNGLFGRLEGELL